MPPGAWFFTWIIMLFTIWQQNWWTESQCHDENELYVWLFGTFWNIQLLNNKESESWKSVKIYWIIRTDHWTSELIWYVQHTISLFHSISMSLSLTHTHIHSVTQSQIICFYFCLRSLLSVNEISPLFVPWILYCQIMAQGKFLIILAHYLLF